MPYVRALDTLGTDVVLDSGDYAGLLDKALAAIEWPRLREKLAARRAAGELVGAGIGLFVEKSGLGPFDQVKIGIDGDGMVEVVSGSASVGQGMETAIAQICADTLGVDYRRVRVTHGQTDRIEHGMGAFASRVTVMTGEATRVAASATQSQGDRGGCPIVADARRRALKWSKARWFGSTRRQVPRSASTQSPVALTSGANLRPLEPALSAEGWFRANHMNYPYGVHIAVTCVDGDTGAVVIERYLVAYDVGRAVNPMLIEGQIVGGCAQGIGGTLLEEFLYDERGEPLSVTLADYLMPTVREMPPVEVIICEDAPSPLNPMGLKGAGEGGANAVGAAVAAAIDDALGLPNAVTKLPITPQRLRRLVRRAMVNQSLSGKADLLGRSNRSR